VALLRGALRGLVGAKGVRLALHALPFVQSVENCSLHVVSAKGDVGVVATATPGEFEWILQRESWLHVAELLECSTARSSDGGS